jgi:hypothetical protein
MDPMRKEMYLCRNVGGLQRPRENDAVSLAQNERTISLAAFGRKPWSSYRDYALSASGLEWYGWVEEMKNVYAIEGRFKSKRNDVQVQPVLLYAT